MTLMIDKKHLLNSMDWAKYTIDGWLEQFGAWCETVRMRGGGLPDGLHINQIY